MPDAKDPTPAQVEVAMGEARRLMPQQIAVDDGIPVMDDSDAERRIAMALAARDAEIARLTTELSEAHHAASAHADEHRKEQARAVEAERQLAAIVAEFTERAGQPLDADTSYTTLREAAEGGARAMLHIVAAHLRKGVPGAALARVEAAAREAGRRIGREEMREEAAVIAADSGGSDDDERDWCRGYDKACRDVSVAIRALPTNPAPTSATPAKGEE